ncbi:MAG: hypothetical protein LBQ95_08650 [Lachnospiraceae bacterium]|jgi:hypothetical protein|nr:hypothetical protein [Lachnospiraceae bacterium]
MTANTDITIYNRHFNLATGNDEYFRTVIRDVYFHTNQRVSLDSDGLTSADEYQIRIPASADTNGKEYIAPFDYKNLPSAAAVGKWTINNSDIVVKGVTDPAISFGELKKHYDNVITVVSYSDNRSIGSDVLKHWRIGGK